MLAELFAAFAQGERRALARLLTLAARGEHIHALHAYARQHPPATLPPVFAVTGSAGVGKSTFLGRLLGRIRQDDRKVAVLACDPQSPVSGGALLGDAFRMNAAGDPGLFVRSLATPGDQGSVPRHLDVMLALLAGFGFDVLFLETVGAGQGDTSVRLLVDATVVLVQPQSGDELQWEKAGLLEIADLIVVHKADLPGADATAAQLRSMLALSGAVPPILRVSSATGAGIDEVWQALQACPRRRALAPADDLERALHDELSARCRALRQQPTAAWRELLKRWPGQDRTPLITEALRQLVDEPGTEHT